MPLPDTPSSLPAPEPIPSAGQSPMRSGRSRPARQITARDRMILAWLARHRFATAAQVAARFGIGGNRAARRLGQLTTAGLLERKEPFRAPSVYLVTRAGLALGGSDLPAPRLDLRTYRHDLGVTGLAIEFELAGLSTLSEREMRARESAPGRRYAARFTPDATGRSPRLHFPDLAIERDTEQLEAIELELTPKRTRRLTAILKAYRRSPHIAAVVYYVERRELGRRIEDLAQSLHMDDRLAVRWW